MAAIHDAYINALLADGAYADELQDNLTGAALRATLTGRMTPTLAEYIGKNFTVLTSAAGLASSFEATVWKENSTENIYVSIRGTQEGPDFSADGDLAASGLPHQQLADMVNWWLRATTPAFSSGGTEQFVRQIRVLANDDFVIGSAEPATGELASIGAIKSVNGHSLGGYLATAFVRLFGTRWPVESISTFNSAGFNSLWATTNIENGFNQIAVLVDAALGPGSFSSSQNNYFASNGINVTTNTWSFDQYGTRIGIFQEDGVLFTPLSPNADGVGINNHFMFKLTDVLALGDALEQLDPTMDLTKLSAIIRAGSVQMAASYESVLDALRRLVLGDGVEPTKVGDVPNGDNTRQSDARVDYQDKLSKLVSSTAFQSLVGQLSVEDLTAKSVESLKNLAVNGDADAMAYRYALLALNSFAVFGPGSLYQSHNQNGELNLFVDAASTPAGITSQYLADRAQMLTFLMTGNTNDTNAFASNQVTEQVLYVDLVRRPDTTSTEGKPTALNVFLPGGTANPNGPNTRVIAFGTGNTDRLRGRINIDRLYGGVGTDYLEGKAGNDYLEGGAGLDLYVYNANSGGFFGGSDDGNDTILDTDGKGVLRTNVVKSFGPPQGTVIADASVKLSGNQWRSADGKFTYTKQSNATGGVDLVVTMSDAAGGSLTLRDFHDGDFGIRLWEARANPNPSLYFIGDKENWDSDPTQDGIQVQIDTFGNARRADGQDGRSDIASLNRDDVFYGSQNPAVLGDSFTTGGGNDIIFADRPFGSADNGLGNADWIVAGAGLDDVDAGPGNDLVEAGTDGTYNGGSAGDLVYGGAGDDELYGNARISLGTAITQGNTATSFSAKGDAISGGAGEDWIVGGAARDVLLGGGGRDLIVAGAGDDDIFGDVGDAAAVFNWSVTRDDGSASGGNVQVVLNGFATLDTTAGGADVIYAGRGVDWAFAGAGDDFVDAGSDSDVAFGEAGADILLGGEGNDYLVGDNPGVVSAADEAGDYLDGGAGNDMLQGDGGDDILVGGPGSDILIGGAGKDLYVFNRGDGGDTVFDVPEKSDRADASVFVVGDGFDRSQLKVLPGSMALDFGNGDRIDIASFDHTDPNAAPAFESLNFADGTSLSFADVLDIGFTIEGTSGDDDGHDAAHPVLVGTAFKDYISGFGGNDELQGFEGDDKLDGSSGNDRFFGGDGADTLLGGLGDDALTGDAGDDQLFGGFDDDALWGGAGNDYLDGGGGYDFLIGGRGDDTYVFQRGATVFDYDGAVRIAFSEGVTTADLVLTRQIVNNTDRVYTLGLKQDTSGLRPMDISLADDSQLASFEFADGTVLDRAALLRETWIDQALVVGGSGDDAIDGFAGADFLQGGDGNDTLRGFGGADRLDGGAGNDTLEGGADADLLLGGAGADLLDGGAGDDVHEGGDGDDVHVVHGNTGRDTIREGGGFDVVRLDAQRADAQIARLASGDLSIRLADGGEVTVAGQYLNGSLHVERLEFGDGMTVELAELDALTVLPIVGTAGNDALIGTQYGDLIQGGAGNDFLDGGVGDDRLEGGPGVDTYRLRLSGGTDQIVEDGAELGVIQLDPGVGFANLGATRTGDDLVLSVNGTNSAVALTDYYLGQTNWSVHTSAGDQNTASDLVAFLGQIENPTTVTGFRDRYTELLRVQYQAYLTSFGATGGVVIDDQGASDAATIFRNPPFSETGSNGTFFLHVARINGGDSANTMDFRSSGLVIADASGGDDLIDNQGAGFSPGSGADPLGSFLYGGEGNDRILGSWGGDTLIGGAGHDFLAGSDGNDHYVVFAGEGTKIIDEVRSVALPGGHDAFAGGRDSRDELGLVGIPFSAAAFSVGQFDSNAVNVLGNGRVYAALDISVVSDLLVRVILPDPNDPALRQFPGESYGVETIRFSDRTLTLDEIFQSFTIPPLGAPGDEFAQNGSVAGDSLHAIVPGLRTTFSGLGGDDAITGGYVADVLDGGTGNDIIRGDAGVDRIAGGPGDDTLFGGPGADTYVYGLGDGVDTIADPTSGGSNTVEFGPGIAPDALTLGLGSLLVRVGDSGGALHLSSFDPDNPFAARDIDRFLFADGGELSYEQLLARGFDFYGTAGADGLTGTVVVDRFRGGRGDDVLAGGRGGDTYFYEIGDGADTVVDAPDAGSTDILQFGAGIDPAGVRVTRSGDDLVILLPGEGDSVTLRAWFTGAERPIERAQFADGMTWSAAELEGRLVAANQPPVAVDDVADVREDVTLTASGNVLANDHDDDPGTVLTVATPGTFAGLYGTLHLSADGNFSYALDNASPSVQALAAGQSVLEVFDYVASDGTEAAGAQLRVSVSGTNGAPMFVAPLDDLSTAEDAAFSFTVSATTFADEDADDALALSASLADGTALPGWLTFDAGAGVLSGTPANADVGTYDIRITATDPAGASAWNVFRLDVANVNDAPAVAIPLEDQSVAAGTQFVFVVPAVTFVDVDAGDLLAVSAALFGGAPLPAWLSFNAATGTFAGTPQESDIGISHVAVSAIDGSGASVISDFGLIVRAADGSRVTGTSGDDVMYGNTGDETLIARGGDDALFGESGDDILRGDSGNDVLQGGAGDDLLRGGTGDSLLDGGTGDDLIFSGNGDSFISGGAGNDAIRLGSGNNVVAFGRGDGTDTLYGGSDGGNTLSFGGGIHYSDLTLTRSGSDLLVGTGGDDQIILKDWYGGAQSILNLQLILDATADFDAGAADPLYNRRVQSFDFRGLVAQFDQAFAQSPGLTSWAMTNALLQFHLSGADDAALGGDLAYWYGRNRTLAGMSLAAAQQVIGAAGFGSDAQSLHEFSGLQDGFVKLG